MIKAKYIERIENDKNILEEDRNKLLEEAYKIQENAINRNNEFLNSNIEYHPCVKEFLLGTSYRWALESYNDGKIIAQEYLKKELNRLNIPLRTEEEYKSWEALMGHINTAHYLTNLEKIAQEIQDETGIEISRKQLEKQIGKLPNYKKRNRVSEKKFLSCLRDIFKNTKIIVNDRDLIKPLELDFVIPKFKLAIEYNGGKFHEDKFLLNVHNMTALEYHSLKREKAKEQGLDLIFVWDDIFYERPLDIINLLKAKDFTNPLLNQLEPPRIESRLLLDEE